MNRYDTTFILNPQIGDDAIEKCVKSVAETITSNQGEILRENRIGSRRLAYPIARQSHGFYVSFIYDGDDNVLKKLDHHFRFGEDYMRSLTVRWEGDPNQENMSDVMLRASRRHDSDDSDSRPSRSRSYSKPDRESASPKAPEIKSAPTTSSPTPASAPISAPPVDTAPLQAPAAPVQETPKMEPGESTSEEDTL